LTVNLNFPVRLVIRLLRAVEKLASDYATVHAETLQAARTLPSKEKGEMWYQSDRELYEEELKAKAKLTEVEIV